MRVNRIKSILIIMLCVMPVRIIPQQMAFKNYNVASGLASNYIFDLYQDPAGFIWIATDRGVSRFDGKSFKNFSKNDGLSDNLVYEISRSSDGALWFATYHGGACRLSGDGFFSVNKDSGLFTDAVIHIVEDNFDRMYFMTEGGLNIWRDSVLAAFPTTSNIPGNLFRHPSGRIIFSIAEKIYEINPTEEDVFKPVEVPYLEDESTIDGNRAWGEVLLKKSGEILFPSRQNYAIIRIDDDGVAEIVNTKQDKLFALLEDHQGRTWHAHRSGVVIYSDNDSTVIGPEQGLNPGYIEALLEDSEGNIWLGSFGGGLFKLKGEYINYFTMREGLNTDQINTILAVPEGKTFIGTEHGVSLIERNIINNLLKLKDVTAISMDKSQKLFVGNYDYLYGPVNYQTNFSGDSVKIPPGVSSIHFDENNTLWVGSYGGGLIRLNRNGMEAFLENDGLPTRIIEKIIKGKNGFWLLTKDHSPVKVADGKFTVFNHLHRSSTPALYSLLEVSENDIWFGTDEGAVRVSGGECIEYSKDDGMLGNYVIGIFNAHGELIFITEKALHKIEKGKFKVIAGPEIFHEDNSEIRNWFYSAETGELWLGTNHGVIRIDFGKLEERRIWLRDKHPRVYIKNVNADSSSIFENDFFEHKNFSSKNEVSYSQNNLRISYLGLNFTSEAPIKYSYKLKGDVESDWSAPTELSEVAYQNLSSGDYTFYVLAINGLGVKSETPASFAFTILPPFYLKFWFLLPFGMFCTGLVIGIVYFVSTQKLKKNIRKLERDAELQRVREKTRERIAGELHDDVASTLSSINLYSDLLTKKIRKEPEKSEEFINKLKDLTKNAQSTMEEVVWSLAPRHDSVQDLINRIADVATEFCCDTGIMCDVRTYDLNNEFKITETARKNIYLILKESMNNIIRHSQAERAVIEVGVQKEFFVLEISDDGVGFSPGEEQKTSKGGHGLLNLRKRAEQIGADLEIYSSPNEGTKVAFKMEMTQMRY